MRYLQTVMFGIVFFAIINSSVALPGCLGNILQRSIDGSCNNLLFPSRGKINELFAVGPEGKHLYPQVYVPRPDPLPTYGTIDQLPDPDVNGSPRRISNMLANPYITDKFDVRNKTNFEVFFGQFVCHDLENNRFVNPGDTSFQGNFVDYARERDDLWCYYNNGYRCDDNDTILTTNIQQSAGVFGNDGIFTPINNATSFLDLHGVYGYDDDISSKLRTKVGGKLKLTKERTFNVTMEDGDTITYTFKNFPLIYDDVQLPLDQFYIMLGNTEYHVVGGDHRMNNNINLAMFYLLFTREHNLVCDELMKENFLWKLLPNVFDEVIFQKARSIVIAKYQKIVYEQYLPALLGDQMDHLGNYDGYNIFTDPSTMTSFSSAASRYGHFSMVEYSPRDECNRPYKDGKPTDDLDYKPPEFGANNPVPPMNTHIGRVIEFGSYENIIRGLITPSFYMDLSMHPRMRSQLNTRGGFDLTTIDIIRSRYNGVATYLELRKTYKGSKSDQEAAIYGLNDCPAHLEFDDQVNDPLECFLYVVDDIDRAHQLKKTYHKVKLIDGIVGMMMESHDETTSIGETLGGVYIEQFKRLRDGDRFYYELLLDNHYFTQSEKQTIMNTTMGELLRRNFDGDEIDFPDNPFIKPEHYNDNLESRCQ